MRKEREKAAATKAEKEGAQRAMDLIFGPPEGCEPSSRLCLSPQLTAHLSFRFFDQLVELSPIVSRLLPSPQSPSSFLFLRFQPQSGTIRSRPSSFVSGRVAPLVRLCLLADVAELNPSTTPQRTRSVTWLTGTSTICSPPRSAKHFTAPSWTKAKCRSAGVVSGAGSARRERIFTGKMRWEVVNRLTVSLFIFFPRREENRRACG